VGGIQSWIHSLPDADNYNCEKEGRRVIFSVIGFYTSPRRRGHLLEILRSFIDLTRPCQGCIGCWLCEEEYLQNYVRYAEQWATEEHLISHIQSDHYLRLLSAVELSERQPEIDFYYTTRTKGFDLIESIRGKSSTQSADRR
jgi:quinol monooxygenase YgiN